MRFAMSTLQDLPRSKITVAPGRVSVTAVADSAEQKAELESRLARRRPDDVALALDIAAPRPVITPFTLRFVMRDGAAPRFEACAVDSEAARARVLEAASAAGFMGKADCEVGLGVPSASWGAAAAEGIAALAELGGGTLTLSDADVSLIALDGTDPGEFERVTSELDTALPDIFALSAVLPEPAEERDPDAPAAIPEFTATRSPEGQVQLRGRLYDAAQEQAVLSYGRALFGVQETYIATREDDAVPQGWPKRVLAGLDALARLESGVTVVRPDRVTVRGVTGNSRAEAVISGLLSEKLGAEAEYRIEVEYREELDPLLNIPTPEECEAKLNDILVEQKLSFAPGEAVIEAAGDGQLGRLTAALEECERSAFEIGGHTDSQGRESMNQELSQQRADAVRAALISRGTPPSQLVAVGYGETQPIADNDTAEGREANRRITFTLLGGRDRDAAPEPAAAAAPAPADEEVSE
jgi:OOP family OmpA-OmpF porin